MLKSRRNSPPPCTPPYLDTAASVELIDASPVPICIRTEVDGVVGTVRLELALGPETVTGVDAALRDPGSVSM
jgi:hypothetical protein